jgi:PKD repeat protein
LRDWRWTFEDGEFSTNTNPTKVFKTPGLYHARLTVTDTNGNTARNFVTVKAVAKLSTWLASKFSAADLQKSEISGPAANPDGDLFPNMLEFALGLEPTIADPPETFTCTATNNVLKLTYPRYKFAGDVNLALESTPDFVTWTPVETTIAEDSGTVELQTYQEPIATDTARFFRLHAQFQPAGQ